MEALAEYEFLNNTLLQWGIAALAFLATFTVLPLIKGYVAGRRRKWNEMHGQLPVALDLITSLVERTGRLFLWIVAVYVGSRFLDIHPRAERLLEIMVVVISWLQVGIWAVAAVQYGLERRQKGDGGTDAVAAGSLTIIMFVVHLIVWAIIVLLALSNLGVNITALVTGLGIGGIAIALAVQTVLGDLLASLSIALDKPFRIGDTLGIDDYTGTVEDIGVKSTRLRSVSGEQLIISNADILKSRVRNLGRMPEQRALQSVMLDYETPRDKVKLVPELMQQAVAAQPNTRFVQCILKGFNANGLEFELIYYALKPKDYARTVDAVNQQIVASFDENDIRFAYPTRVSFQPVRSSTSV